MEKLETVFKTSPLVEQIWVYGSSLESHLLAVVVPAAKPALAWAAENNVACTKGVQVGRDIAAPLRKSREKVCVCW